MVSKDDPLRPAFQTMVHSLKKGHGLRVDHKDLDGLGMGVLMTTERLGVRIGCCMRDSWFRWIVFENMRVARCPGYPANWKTRSGMYLGINLIDLDDFPQWKQYGDNDELVYLQSCYEYLTEFIATGVPRKVFAGHRRRRFEIIFLD